MEKSPAFLFSPNFRPPNQSRIIRKTGGRETAEAGVGCFANVEVMRKQRAVIPVETIVPREVVGKIPVKAQRLAPNHVGDVARRENDVQIALSDRKRLTVCKSVAE